MEKLMIITNEIRLVSLVKCALASISVDYAEYLNDIRILPAPGSEQKKRILMEWQADHCQALLVDVRGCRGMECKQVNRITFMIIFILFSLIFRPKL